MSTHRTDAASGNSNLLCKSWADLAFTICAIHLAAAISAVCCGIMVVERLVAVCRAASGNTKKSDTLPSKTSNYSVFLAKAGSRPATVSSSHKKTPSVTKSEKASTSKKDIAVPSGYEMLTEHEAGWLAAYYREQIAFWSPYTIPPSALKAPAYQQQLDVLVHTAYANKKDMSYLSFATFVCEQKSLPYTGMVCFHVMQSGEFLQLEPPVHL